MPNVNYTALCTPVVVQHRQKQAASVVVDDDIIPGHRLPVQKLLLRPREREREGCCCRRGRSHITVCGPGSLSLSFGFPKRCGVDIERSREVQQTGTKKGGIWMGPRTWPAARRRKTRGKGKRTATITKESLFLSHVFDLCHGNGRVGLERELKRPNTHTQRDVVIVDGQIASHSFGKTSTPLSRDRFCARLAQCVLYCTTTEVLLPLFKPGPDM